MRTATHSYLLASLLLGSVCFAACSNKEEAPSPDPAVALEFTRYIDFAATAPGGGTTHSGGGMVHTPADITGTARLDAPSKLLVLHFVAAPDQVNLEVDQAQLRPAWVGTYALRCQARPADPVFVSYLYTDAARQSTTILRLSDWTQQLDGNVIITAYDPQRRLVSGSYEVTAPNQPDPRQLAGAAHDPCTVLLTGKFTNLKVTL